MSFLKETYDFLIVRVGEKFGAAGRGGGGEGVPLPQDLKIIGKLEKPKEN